MGQIIDVPNQGRVEFPDGMSEADIVAAIKKNALSYPAKEPSMMSGIKQAAGNLLGGAVRGAGSIGATILAPIDIAKDALAGKGLSLESNRKRRDDIDSGLQYMGAQPDSLLYKGGKLGGEIAGTMGAGGALANGVRAASSAPAMTSFANALATGGMSAGATGGLLTRMAGGGVAGAAQAAMVNPSDAGSGAIIGAALPPALMGLGKIGGTLGRALVGHAASPELQAQIAAARDAGYVIPPSQAKPSMVNRALEGFSGKITTAQNASARNQKITNELARKAIGATELSPAGIDQVRRQANAAYDALGQAGVFQADSAFTSALDNAGVSDAAMRANFPELVNGGVDDLVSGLKSRTQFDAQPTIEAIKQFRANAAAMKRSDDPAKLAMARAQSKIAGALEDLIDRNLQQSGNSGLLDSYRAARQTLAKTYDVEKALNPATGNIDASKLAQILKKGRPMTGDLRTAAEFASTFPKAAQSVERMGSLPQTSPLDFAAGGALWAGSGNPLMMAGIAARPLARAASLSNVVQNRLMPSAPGYLERLMQDPQAQQLAYRTAPLLGGD